MADGPDTPQPLGATKPSAPKISTEISDKERYAEGSKVCIQYIQSTMALRTLSQQTLVVSGVGIGLLVTRPMAWTAAEWTFSLTVAGSIIVLFALSLLFLNLHFAMGFDVVRDYLSELEGPYPKPDDPGAKVVGPWQAHRRKRQQSCWSKCVRLLAWYLPFLSLLLIGAALLVIPHCWTP